MQGAIVKETLRVLALITSRLPVTSPNQELVYKEWAIPAGVSTDGVRSWIVRIEG